MSVGRCGGMNAPPGSSSPVSSKVTTPLQSRLQPCSGWLTTVCAASRSGAEGAGQGGVCGHISAPLAVHRACFRLVVACAAHAAIRRFQSTLAAARRKWPIRTRPITRADHIPCCTGTRLHGEPAGLTPGPARGRGRWRSQQSGPGGRLRDAGRVDGRRIGRKIGTGSGDSRRVRTSPCCRSRKAPSWPLLGRALARTAVMSSSR